MDDHATHGQTVGSDQAVHVDELDWLEEGYEGPDYPDDRFGAQNNEVPNIKEHQRDTEKVNKGEHLKEQVTDNGKKPEVLPVIKLLMMMIGLKKLLIMMTLGA